MEALAFPRRRPLPPPPTPSAAATAPEDKDEEEKELPLPLESIPTALVNDALLSQRCTFPAASPTAKVPGRTVRGQSVVQTGEAAAARETAAAEEEERKASEEEEEEEEELGSITAVAYR